MTTTTATTPQPGAVSTLGLSRLLDSELRQIATRLGEAGEPDDLVTGVHVARLLALDLLDRLDGHPCKQCGRRYGDRELAAACAALYCGPGAP